MTKDDLTRWQLFALVCWKFAIFVPCHAIGWIGHALDDASFRFMSATAPPLVRSWFEDYDRAYDQERAAAERGER
jgi:hypothetical protein